MWEDHPTSQEKHPDLTKMDCANTRLWAHGYQPSLTFDESLWDTLLSEMATVGVNMVLIDLGDAVLYDSHPEIAVDNAWSKTKLRGELEKMRSMNLEPIPKLNFATTHDIWLKDYSRMVSTDIYYNVCKDLIEEVIDLFDTPRFFHLGMDEETPRHQHTWDYVVLRQNELWWNDLYFLADLVSDNSSRPWIWSDYAWNHENEFFKKMPKSILQSNWYYGKTFETKQLDETGRNMLNLYDKLNQHGYDQIPTGSNHSNKSNFGKTVDYANQNIDSNNLLGFLMAPWRPTLASCGEKHFEAINLLKTAKNSISH
jgi:hypothetical protein